MARAASTYRGARRNAKFNRPAVGNKQGKPKVSEQVQTADDSGATARTASEAKAT